MTRGVWEGGDQIGRRSAAAKKGARSRKAAAQLHAALTDPKAPPIKAPKRGSSPLAAEDGNPLVLMRRALDGLKAQDAS